ncbi:hypothetical protein CF319_g1680 [Tilletia indica]|nr:hypothetical protein CF319_g1680 [Tilletia indica]
MHTSIPKHGSTASAFDIKSSKSNQLSGSYVLQRFIVVPIFMELTLDISQTEVQPGAGDSRTPRSMDTGRSVLVNHTLRSTYNIVLALGRFHASRLRRRDPSNRISQSYLTHPFNGGRIILFLALVGYPISKAFRTTPATGMGSLHRGANRQLRPSLIETSDHVHGEHTCLMMLRRVSCSGLSVHPSLKYWSAKSIRQSSVLDPISLAYGPWYF